MTTLKTSAYGTTINWWHCNACGELRRQLGNELPPPAERVCAFCKAIEDERRYQRDVAAYYNHEASVTLYAAINQP